VDQVSDGGQVRDNEVRWRIGALPAGGRRTVEVTVHAEKPGEVVHQVVATTDRNVSASAEAKTTFEAAAGLHVEIDKTADPLEVGGRADFVIRVLNRGGAAAANVGVTVEAPEQLEARGEGPTKAAQDGQTITFAPVESLPAGGEAKYVIHVRALKAGAVKLAVKVTSDDLKTPLREEETMTLFGGPPPEPRLPGGP
jgi:uncharacterized membrane protein